MTTTWQFATAPTAPRRASVILAAFGRGPLREGVPFSLEALGAPTTSAIEPHDVRSIARADDPAWFDGWRAGSLREIAERDVGADGLAALDAADHVHMITAAVDGPTDLGYLQGAWALARYLVARGAEMVFDAHAMRFAAKLPPPDRALDVGREVQIVFETDSTRSDRAHALHTRGMIKFGAPDLIALCTDDDADLVCRVIAQLAAAIARGTDVGHPRHRVGLTESEAWYLVPDVHGLAHLLQLNNTARILVDADGNNLLGVAQRTS